MRSGSTASTPNAVHIIPAATNAFAATIRLAFQKISSKIPTKQIGTAAHLLLSTVNRLKE